MKPAILLIAIFGLNVTLSLPPMNLISSRETKQHLKGFKKSKDQSGTVPVPKITTPPKIDKNDEIKALHSQLETLTEENTKLKERIAAVNDAINRTRQAGLTLGDADFRVASAIAVNVIQLAANGTVTIDKINNAVNLDTTKSYKELLTVKLGLVRTVEFVASVLGLDSSSPIVVTVRGNRAGVCFRGKYEPSPSFIDPDDPRLQTYQRSMNGK